MEENEKKNKKNDKTADGNKNTHTHTRTHTRTHAPLLQPLKEGKEKERGNGEWTSTHATSMKQQPILIVQESPLAA